MAQKVLIREEQIYVVAHTPEGFLLNGSMESSFPWDKLRNSYVYAARLTDLEMLLADAVNSGYQVLTGNQTDRRGLRGFVVGIGAWGWNGKVDCRMADVWGFFVEDETQLHSEIQRIQQSLRGVCRRLNVELTPFRSSAFRWLSGLYRRLGEPLEPDGIAEPLPLDATGLARRAHVGGPICHIRTSLSPFCTLDRTRAFGEAMMRPLPAGSPADVPLKRDGLARWRPLDLMRAAGLADATVYVNPGPLTPLLPLLRPDARFDRSRTLYPTGRFRGAWTLEELAYLESSGRGRVEKLHRVMTFQTAPVLRGIVLYLRAIDSELPVKIKRLEHILYGKCALGLRVGRLGTAVSHRPCLPRDLLDDRSIRRLTGKIEIKHWPLPAGFGRPAHPLFKISAAMSPAAERGTMDRPDRSAFITSTNRIEMSKIIDRLDAALCPERSGSFVGRIYVDGLDIEADPASLPKLPGVELRRYGSSARIYRSGAISATLHDGTVEAEGAGLVSKGATHPELMAALKVSADMDGGPFASGRIWRRKGAEEDPRMETERFSEPPHIDEHFADILGFSPDFGASAHP